MHNSRICLWKVFLYIWYDLLPKALPAIDIKPVFVPKINRPSRLWYKITVIPRAAKVTGLEFLARCIERVKI